MNYGGPFQKFVKKFNITNTVLWDSTDQAGRCYNGGELPTNVIIGPGGEIKRRFLGPRSAATWERLLAEAGLQFSQPPPPAPGKNPGHASPEDLSLLPGQLQAIFR